MNRRAMGLAVLALGVGCGGSSGGRDSDSATTLPPPTSGATESASDGGSGGPTDTGPDDCGPNCVGECVAGVCCQIDLVCGDICCEDGTVCSFQECVAPGADCVDAGECEDGEYCEYSLGEPGQGGMGMCAGGASLATGKCLPQPPECPDGQEWEEDLDCLPRCEFVPESSFDPELKHHWSAGDSMMAPIIVQLDDDNCDNVVDERDIPEIVFATFGGGAYTVNGTLRVISIVNGAIVEKQSINPQGPAFNPGLSIAGGNIDITPGNEVVVCSEGGQVRAFDHDLTDLWTSAYAGGCFMPSIADMDQDGTAEIIVQAGILDGATGATEATFPNLSSVVVSDVDGDGFLDVVGPGAAYRRDGTLIVDTALGGSHPAVADFDLDGVPEVATINGGNHTLHIWRVNGASFDVIRSGVDINAGTPPCPGDTGGGPPTIADFNGDGTPDVGVAAGVGYAVFDGADLFNPAVANVDTLMWLTPATDCSSRQTGSSVFDFDGDGRAEVVYGDEQFLRIYDGTLGTVLFETCNTTGTLWEYPLIADVDSDGHADIVAVSNAYSSIVCAADGSKQNGLRIFGDSEGKWVRTRRVWNQHPYHVTNVEEDGTIPQMERPNWTVNGLNNFRQNVQPEGEFAAPDLVPKVLPHCTPDEYGVIARVRNIGRAAVPQGVPVGFYEGDPASGGPLLGTEFTTKVLYPAEAEDLLLLLPDASAAIQNGSTEVFVVVDDGMPAHAWTECNTDNNKASAPLTCNQPG